MKRIIITTILLLSLSIQSQKKKHIVELKIKKELPVDNFYISEIIDNRIIKDNIGFAQKGLLNKKVPAVLPDSLEVYLKEKLEILVPKKENSTPITLIIHEFNVSERTTAFSEKGMFRTQIEFAKKAGDKLLSLWYCESEVEKGGMDVTKGHRKRVLKGISECIESFNKSDWQNTEGSLIDKSTKVSYDYSKVPKAGLYASFSQLAKNNPMNIRDYRLKPKKGKKYPKYKLLDKNGKKINKRVVFISDGKDIYINASRYSYDTHFVKSKMIGRYIYFEDRVSDADAALAFGLIGAAISNQGTGIVVDTKDGMAYLLNKKNTLQILEPYPGLKEKYLKRRKGSKKDALKKLVIKTINEMEQQKK